MVRRVHHTPRIQRRVKVKKSSSSSVGSGTQSSAGISGAAGNGGMGDTDDDDDDGTPGGRHFRHVHFHKTHHKSLKSSLEAEGASEAEADTAASSAMAVRRKGNSQNMGGGGFGDSEDAQKAYQVYLKTCVKEDAERFAKLRSMGTADTFDPGAAPVDIEALGQMNAAKHLVRMYDHWTLQGLDHAETVQSAAQWLTQFTKTENIRKVITELESKPIRDIYPLEVLQELVETEPHRFPNLKQGSLIGKNPMLGPNGKVYTGHSVNIPVPQGFRLKAFALLGGARPGYEFYPSKKNGHYTLIVDTPGEWVFSLLAVRTKKLGSIERETDAGILETFTVHVRDMGRKEDSSGLLVDEDDEQARQEDPAAEEPSETDGKQEIKMTFGAVPGANRTGVMRTPVLDDDDSDEGGEFVVPSIAEQSREALLKIQKDKAVRNRATTYSLDVMIYQPGTYASEYEAHELLHVVVEEATPMDPAWGEAREGITALMEREGEEGEVFSVNELKQALRRARALG